MMIFALCLSPTSQPISRTRYGRRQLAHTFLSILALTVGLSAVSLGGAAGAAEISGNYKIRVKQSGNFLQIDGRQGGDQLASTRTQSDDNYARFRIKPAREGTYTIYSMGNNRPLHVDANGDQYASTRANQESDETKYFLESQTDGTYKIRLKATGKYLHVDGEGSKLATTAIQFDDGYSRYFLVKQTETPGLPSPASSAVNGLTLASVQIFDGTKLIGIIRETGHKQWVWEETAKNQRHSWREERRTNSSVFLSSNGSYIELNIPQSGVFGSDTSFRTGNKYYPFRDAVAKKTPSAPLASPSNATVRLTNVGDQPLTVTEQNGGGSRSLGTLPAGGSKDFATTIGLTLIVRGPDGRELSKLPVNSPLIQRALAIRMGSPNPATPPSQPKSAVTGMNVTSFEVWNNGKHDSTYRQKQNGKWALIHQFDGRPEESSHQYVVQKREANAIWLINSTQEGLRADLSQGTFDKTWQGSIQHRVNYYTIRNAASGASSDARMAVTFDPEWYRTRDQTFSSHAGKRPGAANWASAKKPVANMEDNLKGYYFPEMYPYDLQVKGTRTELNFFVRIPYDSQEFITEDASYPKSFFYKPARNGKFTKTGQMFFSESERQKSMSTAASVSAGGYGVSVGLEGRYGTDKATTSGKENASVIASGYSSRYWLVLNKRNVELSSEFKRLVLASRSPTEFMKAYGSHYPLAILYGFRGFFDQKIDKTSFAKKASESWGVSANAGGGAFGVNLAVAASYDQSGTFGSTKNTTLENSVLTTVGGKEIDEKSGTSDEDSAPIKVELRPVYELIRPDLFSGEDPDRVLAKRKEFKSAYEALTGMYRSGTVMESDYERNNGISRRNEAKFEMEAGVHAKHGIDVKSRMKVHRLQSQVIGSPILFILQLNNYAATTPKVTDSLGRPISVKKFRNTWACYMTVVPDVVGGKYDYHTDSTITIVGKSAITGATSTKTLTLNQIRLGRKPFNAAKFGNMRTPKFDVTYLKNDNNTGTTVIGYAERAFTSTVAGGDGLPLPPWEQ